MGAMERKEGIERILKRIQAIDRQLRYQVRMGEDDLVVKVKYHFKDDYRPYVSISIEDIDPNGTVKDWDLVMTKRREPNPNLIPASTSDWSTAKEKEQHLVLQKKEVRKETTEKILMIGKWRSFCMLSLRVRLPGQSMPTS